MARFYSGEIDVGDLETAPAAPEVPARPDVATLRPAEVPTKIKHDVAANCLRLIHTQAHIESFAVDLAWDILLRFARYDVLPAGGWDTEGAPVDCADASTSPEASVPAASPVPACPHVPTRLPRAYFAEWLRVADDEARHYMTWHNRLLELGSHYGAFPVHNGLWQSASDTSGNLLARLAVVHMVHEAHGLDCGRRLVNTLRGGGDLVSAALLTRIQEEEISHVGAGATWFKHICTVRAAHLKDLQGQTATVTAEEATTVTAAELVAGGGRLLFQRLVPRFFKGALRPPFAVEERARAGLPEDWYTPLAAKPVAEAAKPVAESVAAPIAAPDAAAAVDNTSNEAKTES